MERALADSGELQQGSNMGKGQVKAADFFLQPDIVTANQNSGGGGLGGALGGLGGGLLGHTAGAIAGGISVKKGEANVTLDLVDARTTEEKALTEGYARKSDVGWSANGSLWGGGGQDVFQFNALTDLGTTSANWDVIADFASGSLIDLSALDANTATAGTNEAFTFIGTAAFSSTNATGQLRYVASGGGVVVYGSTDADSAAEFAIQLLGVAGVAAADFVL